MAKSEIGIDIVREDVKRNGIMQMLADLAEARKTGIPLTPEAEEYVIIMITNPPQWARA